MGTSKNGVMSCARHFFAVKYSKRSNVLNLDENIGNISLLVWFLLAGGDKVGSLADVELLSCGSLADSLLQLSFVPALL